MVEELHSVVLDTKERCHRERLQRAEVIKKDFAVEIRNLYRKVCRKAVAVVVCCWLGSSAGMQRGSKIPRSKCGSFLTGGCGFVQGDAN